MSSQFLDSLRRENKAKENLQYDDGAFYYFFSAGTLLILVPLVISLVSQFLEKNRFNINKEAATTLGGHDVQGFLSKKEKASKFNKSLFYKLILAIFLVFLYSQIASKSDSEKQLKGFDPYEILEIPKDTEDQEVIKKAFRKLSIKYHPDRNPDDPNAANKFMLLTKALNCLTDEKIKEQCLSGNPDGTSGSFSIGIALPSFLLEKENRVPVLVVFFVCILIVIPYFVLSWYSEVSKYDMDGTLVDDKPLFIQNLNENLIVKNCPRVLSFCLEFEPILPVKATQKQDMIALHAAVNEHIGKVLVDAKIVKPHDLIHAYMIGLPIGQSLIEDTLFILQKSPKLIEALINFSLKVPRVRIPNGTKAYGLRCAQSMIDFSQLFYQGLWPGDSSLLQLSVLDRASMDALIKKKKKVPELKELVRAEDKRAHLGFLPEDKIDEAVEELEEFPNIDVKTEIFVEDESDIRVGDIVTVKVTLTRLNKNHKDTPFKYLKSNRFPFNEKEKWYIFIGSEIRNVVFMSEDATFGNKTFEKKFLFPADNPGEFSLKIFVRSNGYLGLDNDSEARFKVVERGEKKKYEIHPDDLAIKKEPTFFEQLTMGAKPDANDSDEELEDDDKTKKEKDAKDKKNE